MKQKNSKQLRQLAKQLPDVFIVKKIAEIKSGKDMLKTHSHFNGKPINPHINYNTVTKVVVKKNHYEALKQAYKLQGENGCATYIAWARRTAETQKKQSKKTESKKTENKKWYSKIISFIKKIIK